MPDKIAVAFEIVDHGIQNAQYFQGCGTSFTDYTDVATGIGDTFSEALDDALENLAQTGWNVDIVVPDEGTDDGTSVQTKRDQEKEEERAALFDDDDQDDTEDNWSDEWDEEHGDDERNYTVSVRVREFDPDHDEKHMKYVGKAIARLATLAIDIHNAQTPSGDPSKLPAMRAERDKLERYLAGREIVLSGETLFTR